MYVRKRLQLEPPKFGGKACHAHGELTQYLRACLSLAKARTPLPFSFYFSLWQDNYIFFMKRKHISLYENKNMFLFIKKIFDFHKNISFRKIIQYIFLYTKVNYS